MRQITTKKLAPFSWEASAKITPYSWVVDRGWTRKSAIRHLVKQLDR